MFLSLCGLMLYHCWLPVRTGNKELVKNADKFWWFGHIWNHYQPHLLQTKEQLVKLMKQNYEFAVVSQYIFLQVCWDKTHIVRTCLDMSGRIPTRNIVHVTFMFHAIIIDLHALHNMHVVMLMYLFLLNTHVTCL